MSPNQAGVIKIRNSKAKIASDPLRFEELEHIEKTMNEMQVLPDFGYQGDNFVIRDSKAPRNWQLLTDFCFNKGKYEWLQNFLYLRDIRIKQEKEAIEKRNQAMMYNTLKKANVENESPEKTKHKRKQFVITAKEMEELE